MLNLQSNLFHPSSITWKAIFTTTIFLLGFGNIQAQTNLGAGSTFTENFNGLGTTATATLPSNWKAFKSATERITSMDYSSVSNVTALERAGGNSLSSSAGNGIYRFNANNSTTESALGGLAAGSASKTVVFMKHFNNNGSSSIDSFQIAYGV
jgi:hypothetical protein